MFDANRELVKRLTKEGFRSESLERLRERYGVRATRSGDQMKALEQEMLSEMAASLGRSEEKLLIALVLADVARQDFTRLSPDDPGRQQQAKLHDDACDDAERCRRNLLIQREALGIRRGRKIVEQMFPIPRRLGPVRGPDGRGC